MSSRYAVLVERQIASPVIVVAASMFVPARKFGPPESPKQPPPLPADGFSEIRSHDLVYEFDVPFAAMRTSL